jgi:hypothetical protein
MFIEIQCAYFILRNWKENPAATKREIGLWSKWKEEREENDRPLSSEEVASMKAFLRRHASSSYSKLFPKNRS